MLSHMCKNILTIVTCKDNRAILRELIWYSLTLAKTLHACKNTCKVLLFPFCSF